MAHSEACQLFIEQQIEEGLQEGKTPYSIGKDLSLWIEKLFVTKISPNTLEVRAHRIKDRLLTNVSTGATSDNDSGFEEIQVEPDHGGQRSGAGRPAKYDVPVARGEREILQKAKEIQNEKRETNRTARIETITSIARSNKNLSISSVGCFPIILCDPPWRYEYSVSDSREIENQYPTMTLEEICAFPIAKVAMDDCVLFMWATSPKLEESIKVLNTWGFEYRTCAVWDKGIIGMGYYFRQQHELLLVATKGSVPTPAPGDRVSSVICSRRESHSKKPDIVYEIIEAMYPELPKLEMFCRNPRHGWEVWGNQC